MRMPLFLVFLMLLSSPAFAKPPSIGADEAMTLDQVSVGKGQEIEIDYDVSLAPQKGFENSGTIKSYGYIDLSGLTSNIANDGKITILGSGNTWQKPHLRLKDTDQLRKLMRGTLIIGGDSYPAVMRVENLSLYTGEFYRPSIGESSPGRLNLADWALIDADKLTVTGQGDQLGISRRTFYSFYNGGRFIHFIMATI